MNFAIENLPPSNSADQGDDPNCGKCATHLPPGKLREIERRQIGRDNGGSVQVGTIPAPRAGNGGSGDRAAHVAPRSFFLLYPALNGVVASDLVFVRTSAHKLFNLARSNECSPKGSTRRITDRARFTHQPVMIFSKHGVAAIGTANFMRQKADK